MAGDENRPDGRDTLIGRMILEDIIRVKSAHQSRVRPKTTLTDEEVAFKLFEEESLALVQTLKLVCSIQAAIDNDSGLLETIDIAETDAEDDHQYALALSRGEALPTKTSAQNALESVVPASSTAGSSTIIAVWVECVICEDDFRVAQTLQAPCEHHYCINCLRELVQACLRDEALFPLRCCQQSLPDDQVLQRLSATLRAELEAKSIEFSTLPIQRVYCSNPPCSRFPGSSDQESTSRQGTASRTSIYCFDCFNKLCKQRAHPPSSSSSPLPNKNAGRLVPGARGSLNYDPGVTT
ncbi:hypothetical protein D9757_011683 [Collybiopsis confluens]|uniref:RING-type domain-containing protein n=1 Tax=Collybiopsis confluens TaxID=2823264 RepID=A0A8H5GLJ9_9AGAR|nr:hypothetical protein D9757_011683 [Collybiopsis confluens]